MRGMGIRYKKLGELLRDARHKSGISADEATMMLGLANSNFLYNAEGGYVNFPARKILRAIEIYGIKRESIIEAVIEDDMIGLSKFLGDKK